jgi:hypothetical protein
MRTYAVIISDDFLTSSDLSDAGWRWSASAVRVDEQDADHDHRHGSSMTNLSSRTRARNPYGQAFAELDDSAHVLPNRSALSRTAPDRLG